MFLLRSPDKYFALVVFRIHVYNSQSHVKSKFHHAIRLASLSATKPKFHYAIQIADRSQTGRRPGRRPTCACRVRVAGRSKAGRKPAANRSATRFELSRHVEIARSCLRQVGNQVCHLDSVMEFGATKTAPRFLHWPANNMDSMPAIARCTHSVIFVGCTQFGGVLIKGQYFYSFALRNDNTFCIAARHKNW